MDHSPNAGVFNFAALHIQQYGPSGFSLIGLHDLLCVGRKFFNLPSFTHPTLRTMWSIILYDGFISGPRLCQYFWLWNNLYQMRQLDYTMKPVAGQKVL